MARTEMGLIAWALAQPEMVPLTPAVEVIVAPGPRALAYLLTKRIADLVLSLLLLATSWPIMLVTAIAIKLTSPGPILFRQWRAGRDGQAFVMYKFRSMREGAEEERLLLASQNDLADGPCFKLRNDPRLTPIGRFLRQTSIDELPQLFNVLKGEMTLVGPRPLPLDEVGTGTTAECRRLRVQPGLTCLWQISGRCEIPYVEWVLLDLYYIEHRSLLLDLEILIKTVPAVLSRRGAF